MNNDQDAQRMVYQIKVRGRLDESWSGWFNSMTITFEGNTTTLTGAVVDQAALRGILCRLWDLNLALISVNQIEPDYEFEGGESNGGDDPSIQRRDRQ